MDDRGLVCEFSRSRRATGSDSDADPHRRSTTDGNADPGRNTHADAATGYYSNGNARPSARDFDTHASLYEHPDSNSFDGYTGENGDTGAKRHTAIECDTACNANEGGVYQYADKNSGEYA